MGLIKPSLVGCGSYFLKPINFSLSAPAKFICLKPSPRPSIVRSHQSSDFHPPVPVAIEIASHPIAGRITNSESSVNFKHARRNEREGIQGSPSSRICAYIDFDPHPYTMSSDTQEQSGHTPPDYKTNYVKSLTEAPSPAKEDSTETEGIEVEDMQGGTSVDPAELEWLIYNAASMEEAGLKNDNSNLEIEVGEDYSVVMKEDAFVADRSLATPTKSTLDAVRRSARITNRSGPMETVERYTLAAMRKGLELQAEMGIKKVDKEDLDQEVGMFKEEDWERVAEGAGYVISPKKKEVVANFIKGTTRVPA